MREEAGVRRRLSRAIFALTVTCAALFAHVAIDVAGDFLLAHDAYDDVAHYSRESIFGLALFLALLVLWQTLRAARAHLAGSYGALRALLRSAVPTSCTRFIAVVGAGTLPALMAMACLDSVIDARRLDDISDVFGGSVPLGVGCVLASAVLVGAVVWHAVRTIARFERAILHFVAVLAQRSRHQCIVASAIIQRYPRALTAVILCARSVGLRAPPRTA